jgi:hypothetical protein
MSGRRNPSSGIVGFDGSGAGSGTMVATGTASAGLLASAGFAGSGVFGLNNEHAGKHARHSATMLTVKNFADFQSARIEWNEQSRSGRRWEELLVICDWLLGEKRKKPAAIGQHQNPRCARLWKVE